jgi:hypothetical protein
MVTAAEHGGFGQRQSGGRRLSDISLQEIANLRKEQQESIEGFDKRLDICEGQNREILAAVKACTEAVTKVQADTQGIVQVYRDIQGTVRVGGAVQRFVFWCIKAGGYAGGLAFLIMYLINKFDIPLPPPSDSPPEP